ncbi:cilia- and flagella-associated protein 61-like [Pectinophora gossypiella]|uniref:cilia- and flagella-associated protein 61-like n=1 Tax=Pectinophora gossypiella TaxID=13191 RepID=UPI00214EFC77|nr:cilia- and flagella-associated protein 61-like [Pectinophora gossypiella]
MTRSRPKLPTAMGKVRLSDQDDVNAIMELCNESMKTTFRIKNTQDILYLIENSVLAITQLDADEEVIGFLSAREYPLVPSVHPTGWEEYIWSKYKAIDMNARNTLFIHLMCWNTEYSRDVVDAMLRSVFMHDPYIHFIGMIKTVLGCLQLVPGSSRAEMSFRRVQAMERGMPGDKLPALLIAERKEVCPRLRVRRAVEEDNDDIVPIIERHSERLRELYGDYYISELIARHPESDRVLVVCEHKELAVGVMCLNTQINFEALEEGYELSPFAGLRHIDQAPKHHRSKDNLELHSNSFLSDINLEYGEDSSTAVNKRLDTKVSVSWTPTSTPGSSTEEDGDKAEHVYAAEDGRYLGRASMLNFLNLITDDEEEFDEFDIVNIEPELLKLPDIIRPTGRMSRNIIDGIKKEKVDDIGPRRDKKKSLSMSGQSAVKPPEYVIRYSGTSNAFLMELFAMHPDIDERYAFDMLEAAYELFPNRDYCVMCLPSSHTSFPLLEHFSLVTPRGTHMRFINESLYVAHINSVRGQVSVRPGEQADLENLFDLLEHVPRRDKVTEMFEESLVNHNLEPYMLLAQNQPVGVVIIGALRDGTSIRTQYDLEPEPRRPGTDGTIIAGVMSPVLEPHGRWYLRDVIRQSKFTTLFWICHPFARGEQSPYRNMMSLAERMIPVRPRRSLPNISGDRDLDRIFRDKACPFALWIMERQLSSFPKVFVNNGIVVVGASRTGLAFLETLITGPTAKYLTFTNLTLVSEHGLPTVAECLKAADLCIPREGRYSDHYLKSVPFCFYLDVVPAVVVSIDRKKKCIHLKGGGVKYYDELVLTCGQQFQHPNYLKESRKRAKVISKGLPCERMLMDNPKYQPDKLPPPPELPNNVFVINCLFQANVVLRKLLKMMTDENVKLLCIISESTLEESNPIVVFGDCIEAYCCISALIELGVMGNEIIFVENFPPEDPTALRVNCFNDETVDERVQSSLEVMGVRMLRQCRLIDWETQRDWVTSIKLMTPLHCINVECYALFYYGLKAIDIHAFKAINECGLVYDGGLVVGPMFETNDPHIYGAGTCCTYSRRLYASRLLHRYYNSEDVGEALANLFLRKMDPFIACHADFTCADLLPRYSSSLYSRSHPSIPECTISRLALTLPVGRRWQPVLKFMSPIVISATYAGPLYYMKVRRPGMENPMEVQMALPHQGHKLITDKNGNYFRLQLNLLHCIDSITCLSQQYFSPEILSQLYGKHEAFFNKLLLRCQTEQIEDFFSFFTQPWMAAIYQENFEELLNNINRYDIVQPLMEAKKSKIEAGEEAAKDKRSSSVFFDLDHRQLRKPKNFRTMLDNFVEKIRNRVVEELEPCDIPTECGQNPAMREQITAFWDEVGGERVVFTHMARHISRNSVTNPHYAPPNPEYF